MSRIQILIVEPDVVCRHDLKSALAEVPDLEVTGAASTGKLGLDLLRQRKPDLVVLGANLSDMSPLDFTRTATKAVPEIGVLLAASDKASEADMVIQALAEGAFDFLLRPAAPSEEERAVALRRLMLPKIRCFSIKRYSRIARNLTPRRSDAAAEPEGVASPPSVQIDAPAPGRRLPATPASGPPRLDAVLVGVSTGGPEALSRLIPALPETFPVPLIVVLHMPKMFTDRMASALDRKARLRVKEVTAGEEIQGGTVYLAQGGTHLIVEKGTLNRALLQTVDGPPENGCKPAVDVLFRAAAGVFKDRALAVIMTGMGEDGTRGLADLTAHGVSVLVQDEASSVVWGMPGSAVRAGYADEILPLDALADRIVQLVLEPK